MGMLRVRRQREFPLPRNVANLPLLACSDKRGRMAVLLGPWTDCRELDRSFGGLDLAGERKTRPVRFDETNGNASRRKRGLFGLRHPIEPRLRREAFPFQIGRAHV